LGSDATGPALYGYALSAGERATLGGIRFVYEPDGQAELPPGFTVNVNLRVALLATGAEAESIADAVEVTAVSPAASPTEASAHEDLEFTIVAVAGGGAGDGGAGLPLAAKRWAEDVVNARSAAEVSATISWGTGGLGFDS